MNRREIDAMRERLAARTTTEGEEHPAVVGLAVFLFGLALVMACFI
jgi:hypothetical protein